MDEIHIFRLKFTPQITLDDRATRRSLLEACIGDIKANISTFETILGDPIFSGFNIYSIRPPSQK